MHVIYPPGRLPFHNKRTIFLAGSIEMNTAEDWQKRAEKMIYLLEKNDTRIYNPRREDWDSSWDETHPKFIEQVNWELDMIHQSTVVAMYFDPNTKSPITLLELGILTASPRKLHVVCPKGFWRKGNVDIVCQRYRIKQYDTLEELIKTIF